MRRMRRQADPGMNMGAQKNGTCQNCGGAFTYYAGAYRGFPKRFCSRPCYFQDRRKKATKTCSECKAKFFKGKISWNAKVCGRECYAKRRARLYGGKNHPRHAHGERVHQGQRETVQYRNEVVALNGYELCEECGRSNAAPYQVHHIVYRSEAPRHPNLHNARNLILICAACHGFFHRNKANREGLVKKRRLYELFPDHLRQFHP